MTHLPGRVTRLEQQRQRESEHPCPECGGNAPLRVVVVDEQGERTGYEAGCPTCGDVLLIVIRCLPTDHAA